MRFKQADLFDRPVPAGSYLARVASLRETRSREGNPMVVATFRLENERGAGREVSDYFVTDCRNPSAVVVSRRRLVAFCRACGLDPQPNEDFDLSDLEGRFIEVEVLVEPGTRGLWNRVTHYHPPTPQSNPSG